MIRDSFNNLFQVLSDEWQKRSTERQLEFETRRKELTDLEKECLELRRKLEKRDSELERKAKRIEEREKLVQETEKQLESRQRQLDTRQQALDREETNALVDLRRRTKGMESHVTALLRENAGLKVKLEQQIDDGAKEHLKLSNDNSATTKRQPLGPSIVNGSTKPEQQYQH